jgi:hypothetical protein
LKKKITQEASPATRLTIPLGDEPIRSGSGVVMGVFESMRFLL